jgi:hypothetical protein
MRLDFFLLADESRSGGEGKLWISGAGVSHVWGDSLPMTVPRLDAVVRLLVDEADIGTAPVVRFRWIAPEGRGMVETSVAVPGEALESPRHAGEQRAITLVASFNSLTFTVFGTYELDLLIAEEPLAHKSLTVVEATSGQGE